MLLPLVSRVFTWTLLEPSPARVLCDIKRCFTRFNKKNSRPTQTYAFIVTTFTRDSFDTRIVYYFTIPIKNKKNKNNWFERNLQGNDKNKTGKGGKKSEWHIKSAVNRLNANDLSPITASRGFLLVRFSSSHLPKNTSYSVARTRNGHGILPPTNRRSEKHVNVSRQRESETRRDRLPRRGSRPFRIRVTVVRENPNHCVALTPKYRTIFKLCTF